MYGALGSLDSNGFVVFNNTQATLNSAGDIVGFDFLETTNENHIYNSYFGFNRLLSLEEFSSEK